MEGPTAIVIFESINASVHPAEQHGSSSYGKLFLHHDMCCAECSLQRQAADCATHRGSGQLLQWPAQRDSECSQSISSLVASLLCFPGDLKASVPGQHNEPDIGQAGVAIHLHRNSRSLSLACFTEFGSHHHGSSTAVV